MQPISTLLAKRLILTHYNDEQEEYLLQKEDEWAAIEHELSRLKAHMEWKMKDKGLSLEEVKLKISQIDWSEEIDIVETLERANSNLLYALWEQEQRELEKKEVELKQAKLKEAWTANQMFKLLRWTSEVEEGKKLIVNDYTMPLIKAMCYFLSEDERFESELGFSLSKGIMIRGISGLGKTHVVKCLSKNELHPILVVSMIEIAHDIKSSGEYNLPSGYSKFYLDDVGSEESTVNYYGTKINWLKDFLETFYLRSNQYNRLIVSTNNNAAQMEKLYGFRVRSRMREMFNVIDVDGKDLRGL
jgi:hypothetical protein